MKCKIQRKTLKNTMSPSMRREWIEMAYLELLCDTEKSPSMRREWIEILYLCCCAGGEGVSLHAEGVD